MKDFFDTQNEKITEKTFSQSMIVSVISILLCIVALCSITYAWFAEEAVAGNNTITAGKFTLDASVTWMTATDPADSVVTVVNNQNGTMSCILEQRGTYTVVLSMSDEASVKGYCAISINGGENQITAPFSHDPAIGAETLFFVITTAEDNTELYFVPKWGYPANPTITEGTAIVLEGTGADDGEYIISILGDSISTYKGYITEGNATFYPKNYLNTVDDTWWMQLITELDAKLGVNDSWSGSLVGAVSGERLPMVSLDRIAKLDDNGTPDVIVFFGGTNDIAYANGRPIGSFDPATAPISADLSATEWESFADGYVEAILRLKYYYPDTQIIAVLPTLNKSHYNATTLEKYNSIVRSICIYYGIEYVDLVAEGFTTAMLGDATHPNADGMDFITAAVKKVIS